MKYLIYISTILFLSCQSLPPQVHIISKFPRTLNVEGEPITSFDKELGIMSLHVTDNYFLCGSHRTDYHFSVYSKNNISKITDLCKKGRGPGEFIAPAYFSQYKLENGETKIWILDRGNSMFHLINIEKSIHEKKTYIETTLSLADYNRQSFRELFQLNDSTIFGTEDFKECKHFYINLRDSGIKYINPMFKFADDPDPFPIAQTISTINPKNRYIASAYFNFPQIDLINNTGNIYKTILYNEYINPRHVTPLHANEEYYSTISSDSDYIYALHNRGNSLIDEIKTTSSIFVFSWDGVPVCEIKIPYATYLCVDPIEHILYSIDINQEDHIVSKLSLHEYNFSNS